ncbi:MAG: nucleotidyltransferase domain-containing protein [Chloroflexi bacterium]|nr:nucleotidyltransferase domain-containing protein [Chloroflexota bacterium]
MAASVSSVQQLYLFGSIICPGQFHQKSDVDIGVVGTTAEDYFELWRQLEAALPEWLIDLRELSSASFFADRVKERGY